MKSIFSRTRMAFFTFFALSALVLWPSVGRADITITPTSLLIQGRARSADVMLLNTSDKQISYEMGWVFFKMQKDGAPYQPVKASLTDFDLTKNAVFTPRRVTLPPHGKQKVRVALRLEGEPPAPGDYRAHLEFKVASTSKPELTTEPGKDEPKKAISAGIGIKIGYSIPVVYRVGTSNAGVDIGEVSVGVNPKSKQLQAVVPITRTGGPFGILGHVFIYHENGGKESLIGEIANANVFPEVTVRDFVVPLSATSISGGNLKIVFKNEEDKTNKVVIAEKRVPIGK